MSLNFPLLVVIAVPSWISRAIFLSDFFPAWHDWVQVVDILYSSVCFIGSPVHVDFIVLALIVSIGVGVLCVGVEGTGWSLARLKQW